jgi:hypothetical protein
MSLHPAAISATARMQGVRYAATYRSSDEHKKRQRLMKKRCLMCKSPN